MILSRQFRDKTEESFDFEITTTSSPQTVEFLMGAGGRMSVSNYHRIDWGDGSDPEPINSSVYFPHEYLVAGRYTIKIWTREKNYNITQFGGNKLGTGMNITSLDFSGMKQLYRFLMPFSGTVGTITMPTEYEGTAGVQWSNIGGTYTFADTTLDLSIYSSRIDSFFMQGNVNIDRIKTPSTNVDTNCQFFFSGNSGLTAVGPSADNLSNFDADFTNYNLQGQFRLKGTGTNPTSIILPANAFSVNAISNLYYVDNLGCTTMDLSNLKMTSSTNLALIIINNPNLTSITWPTSSSVPGTAGSFNIYGNPSLTGSADISWLRLQNDSDIIYRDSLITSIALPVSTVTLGSIEVYPSTVPAANGQCTQINLLDMPNATEQDGFILRMQDNGMIAAEVNRILTDLDTNATNAFTGRSINLSGTNAAPDTTSGGLDGSAAKTSLIGKGFSVTTS
jgi:hypothetical protein